MNYKNFNLAEIDSKKTYSLLTGIIIPRPIAWISTIRNGVTNLAPFSFFNAVCADPGMLAISFGYKEDGLKDTLANILETNELVVNIADQNNLDLLIKSASEFNTSEIDELNIKTEPSIIVSPPRILGVPVQIECIYSQKIELGSKPTGSVLVLVEIKMIHIREDLIIDGKIDYNLFNPIARLGGISYGKVEKNLDCAIPRLKK